MAFGEIDIFFNAKVGILLTSKKAINTVRYGVNSFISKPKFKFVNHKLKALKLITRLLGRVFPQRNYFSKFVFPQFYLN